MCKPAILTSYTVLKIKDCIAFRLKLNLKINYLVFFTTAVFQLKRKKATK